MLPLSGLAAPADLSLVARSKGTNGFIAIKGVLLLLNLKFLESTNKVLANASMPDALWSLRKVSLKQSLPQSARDLQTF
jgi:ubiquinol-cytochrome c reductase cytochrome c1 subunit